MTNTLVGSVMQVSLIPAELGMVLNIASAPVSELLGRQPDEPQDNLRSLTAATLGMPAASIIDELQYQQLLTTLEARELPPGSSSREEHELLQDVRRLATLRRSEELPPVRALGVDAIALLATPERMFWSSAAADLLVGRTYRDSSPFAEKVNLNTEGLQAGLSCLFAGANPEPRVHSFVNSSLHYDIPWSASPKAHSDSLLKLFDSGKKMVLAPLVAAGTLGITQLGQGAYVAALLTVGAGSAMTLILIGTVAVGDLLVRRLAGHRGAATAVERKEKWRAKPKRR
jgi:hypothetical protein